MHSLNFHTSSLILRIKREQAVLTLKLLFLFLEFELLGVTICLNDIESSSVSIFFSLFSSLFGIVLPSAPVMMDKTLTFMLDNCLSFLVISTKLKIFTFIQIYSVVCYMDSHGCFKCENNDG